MANAGQTNAEFWDKGNRRCATIISVTAVIGLLTGGTVLLYYGVWNMEKINQYKFSGNCILSTMIQQINTIINGES